MVYSFFCFIFVKNIRAMLGTNVEIFNSDDYATMVSGNLYFYYGYEETNPTKKNK